MARKARFHVCVFANRGTKHHGCARGAVPTRRAARAGPSPGGGRADRPARRSAARLPRRRLELLLYLRQVVFIFVPIRTDEVFR